MADVTAPPLREFPVPPAIQPDAMAASIPYVATEKMQEAIGFPALGVRGRVGFRYDF